MPIRFKCRHCKKALAVKEQLAGRKAICPGCRKPIVIPKPKPSAAEVEELAAAMLGDGEVKKKEEKPREAAPIKFHCEFCDEQVQVAASEAGTKMPCPECKRIIRVPVPQEDKPKDWRDIAKKGPIGAKMNQPEALENAWGTEQTRGATRAALEEADALPILVPQNNLGLWLKRGFWTTVALGCMYLAITGIMRSQTAKSGEDAVKEAVKLAPELSGEWAAEVHRAAGELYVARKQPLLAKQQFHKALANLQRSQRPVLDPELGPLDVDLFLIDLVLVQVDMGGTDDEILSRERLPWPEVQREMAQTLAAISKSEAREKALRLLGVRLAERKQLVLAKGLAGSSRPQQVAFDVAYRAYLEKAKQDKDKEVSQNAARALENEKQDLQLPFPKDNLPIDKDARLAHVEGLAHLGKFKEALDLAQERRETDPKKIDEEAKDCIAACISAAEVALAAKQPAEAARCAKKAVELINDVQQRQLAPKWLLFSVMCAGIEADVADIQELAKTLPPVLRPQVNLAILRQKLKHATGVVASLEYRTAVEPADREMLVWPLAWEALARHNARHQTRAQVMTLLAESEDPRIKAFLLVGFALGHK